MCGVCCSAEGGAGGPVPFLHVLLPHQWRKGASSAIASFTVLLVMSLGHAWCHQLGLSFSPPTWHELLGFKQFRAVLHVSSWVLNLTRALQLTLHDPGLMGLCGVAGGAGS